MGASVGTWLMIVCFLDWVVSDPVVFFGFFLSAIPAPLWYIVRRTTSSLLLFVACLRSHLTLTAHAFRDRPPFLLLIETPSTFGRSLRFFHTYTWRVRLSFYIYNSIPFLPVSPSVATN